MTKPNGHVCNVAVVGQIVALSLTGLVVRATASEPRGPLLAPERAGAPYLGRGIERETILGAAFSHPCRRAVDGLRRAIRTDAALSPPEHPSRRRPCPAPPSAPRARSGVRPRIFLVRGRAFGACVPLLLPRPLSRRCLRPRLRAPAPAPAPALRARACARAPRPRLRLRPRLRPRSRLRLRPRLRPRSRVPASASASASASRVRSRVHARAPTVKFRPPRGAVRAFALASVCARLPKRTRHERRYRFSPLGDRAIASLGPCSLKVAFVELVHMAN